MEADRVVISVKIHITAIWLARYAAVIEAIRKTRAEK
jgi:hypothetical protein